MDRIGGTGLKKIIIAGTIVSHDTRRVNGTGAAEEREESKEEGEKKERRTGESEFLKQHKL